MPGKNADVIAHGFREHVRLSPGIIATVKGKLSLGARVLQLGGIEKVFRESFNWEDGEKLMESFECYRSTSTSPIAAGLLFISTEKSCILELEICRCGFSRWEINQNALQDNFTQAAKVPIRKIKAVNEAENMERPAHKYIKIVTVDDSDFWFTGFFNYQKALEHLWRTIHQE
ncbi:hypothetical protein EUGRSUZ_J00353 [Eucalyptus grandis]|uniref:Uncharacterized protein n=2 Tax=Eucalyptus grandis TaxID=71139 RepID=A0ACC3J1D4_EUCGR|nr:hypothetical protein EUGRSUZ_J00353 [Eucalyptus grandis]